MIYYSIILYITVCNSKILYITVCNSKILYIIE